MTAIADQRKRVARRTAGLSLALLPIPLLLDAIGSLWSGDLADVAVAGGGYALFVCASLLMNRGVAGERSYLDRPFAVGRPAPFKTMATVLVGLATSLAAGFGAGHLPAIAAIFGAVAAAGSWMFYGGEPQRRGLSTGWRDADQGDVAKVLREAYERLDRIEGASHDLGTASPAAIEFKQRINNIIMAADKVLKLVEEDPRDLRRARKFINVYLDSAERVCTQFARTHPRMQSPALEHNFRTLLVDIENTCTTQYETLLQNDVLDLDVQIEVLSARLRQEGVR